MNDGQVLLKDKDFTRLQKFIEYNLGIKMPESKRILIQSRLHKFLRKKGFENFELYIDYLLSDDGAIHREDVLNAITTNKTDFFREPNHFDILFNRILKNELSNTEFTVQNPLKIWSAGCSTGQEPYTLGMLFEEHKLSYPKLNYSILATDVATDVLEAAYKGIYRNDVLNEIPSRYSKKYFKKGIGAQAGKVRVVNSLRYKIQFAHLNLMSSNYGIKDSFDIIFCRNVLIYFDKKTQERFVNNFYNHLNKGGFLFLGHSETMTGMNVPFTTFAPTIYRK